MTIKWNEDVSCPRDQCDGQVRVRGYADPGSMYGGRDHLGWPPEYENEADPCDTCGADDWTDDELNAMAEDARSSAADMADDCERGGDGPDD
jgi:hypothetical protein